VHLDQYRGLRGFGPALGGVMAADGEARIYPADIAHDSGAFELNGTQISMRAAPGMPAVSLGDLTAHLVLDQGKINVDQIASHGGDVSISGRGVIQLEPNISDSPLAIKIELNASPEGRAKLGFLLRLLPHPPNTTPYLIGGTLG